VGILATITTILTSSYLLAQAPQQGQSPKPSLSLTIRARNSSTKAGSAVWVEVTARNESDHVIRADTTAADDPGGWIFRADIQGEQGSNPPKTDFYENINSYSVSGSMFRLIKLKPGEARTDSVNVSKLYDLSRLGQYTIQLRRRDLEGKRYVKSNEITVTVTP
jgi:hypothetical protein